MDIENWKSQVRKGVYEYVILLLLQRSDYYGYELIKLIKELTSDEVSEGTIYTLLKRLKNSDLIASQWIESDSGMPRKYYTITEKGRQSVREMKTFWLGLNLPIQKLMVE